MIGLSGSLQAVGFRDLVGFLGGLGKSGALRITHDRWSGEVVFERGQVMAARFGSERGLAALDAIALALPEGEFSFAEAPEGASPPERTITLTTQELLAHLDELLEQRGAGGPDAVLTPATVPFVLQGSGASSLSGLRTTGPGRVALTRGAIQTLLAVDGQRSVAEIAVGRGLADTVKDLQALVRHGLIGVPPVNGAAAAGAPAAAPAGAPAPAPVDPVASAPPPPPAAPPMEPPVEPPAAARPPVAPAAAPSVPGMRVGRPLRTGNACPHLGFADDPTNHFPRPTQLHRCFAGREPQRIASGDQSGLCLVEGFPACARYQAATLTPRAVPDTLGPRDVPQAAPAAPQAAPAAPPAAPPPPAAETSGGQGQNGATRRPPAPAEERRLWRTGGRESQAPPGGARPAAPDADRSANGSGDAAAVLAPAALLAGAAGAAGAAAPAAAAGAAESGTAAPAAPIAPPGDAGSGVPDAPPAAGAVAAPEPAAAPAPPAGAAPGRPDAEAGALVPQGAVALEAPEALPAAPESGAGAAPPGAAGDAATPPPPAGAPRRPGLQAPAWLRQTKGQAVLILLVVAIGAALIAPLLLRPPEDIMVELSPSGSGTPGLVGTAAAGTPAAGTAVPTPRSLRTVFDDRFATNQGSWPNDPNSVSWFGDGGYRLAARNAGQFVAIGAPLRERYKDVVVTGTFHKVAGPAGGGYGLIVRDGGPGARDGLNQMGRFYVFEVGDKGEYGIWRRDGDKWVDIVPWTTAPAVAVGNGQNTLSVQALGPQLTFLINGQRVASQTDGTLQEGSVGVFVGGDGNEVVVERFSVQVPGS